MCNAIREAPRASSLAGDALRGRLRELAGDEREVQVDFLLHLAELDRRKGYLDAGHGSIWNYCLRELRLREGPAARRIAAMRILRQYPALEAPLRDGRLCLTTVTLIAPLLAEFGVADLVARAANLTKAEVEHLVATLRPGSAPRDGIRQLASRYGPPLSIQATRLATPAPDADAAGMRPRPRPAELSSSASGSPHAYPGSASVWSLVEAAASMAAAGPCAVEQDGRGTDAVASGTHAFAGVDRRNAELRPVTADQWSLRVTMDTGMKDDLEKLRSLLSHTAGGDLTAILREALRCAIEKHGKRRGAIAPTRTRSTASAPSDAGRSDDRPSGTGPSDAMPSCASWSETRPSDIEPASEEPLDDPPGPDVQTASGGAGRRDARLPATGSPNTSLRSAARASTVPPGAAPPSTAPTSTAPTSTAPTSTAPTSTAPRAPPTARTIPAAVRREVWARDNGCCSWRSRDGRRCGSRWKLELDHIQPVALGGDSTVANLRLICRAHNVRHAEQIFGRRHMARFTR